LGFDFGQGQEICLLSTPSTPALGPIQPPALYLRKAVCPGIKRPERDAVHSSLPSAEVKNAWSYASTAFMACYSIKHRKNVIFLSLLASRIWLVCSGKVTGGQSTQKNIVTYRPIARQQLGKHIPAGANARKNRASIARQRISKYA
jgi:hypothetical protein